MTHHTRWYDVTVTRLCDGVTMTSRVAVEGDHDLDDIDRVAHEVMDTLSSLPGEYRVAVDAVLPTRD